MISPRYLWNPIGDLIEDAIEKWFTNIAEKAINAFTEFLNEINGIAVTVLDFQIVTSATAYAQSIAVVIVVAKFMFELWYNNILRENGDSDGDVSSVFWRLAEACGIIFAAPWIVRQVYVWGTALAQDVTAMPGINQSDMGDTLRTSMVGGIATSSFPIGIAIAIIFALVLLIIVLIQTFIRAAEISMAAIVGVFMATGLTNPNSQAFQSWWREVLNLSLAQAIQMFLIKASFVALLSFGAAPWANVLLFCGFVWVTYKSPSILKQYVYSTGFGKAAGGAAQQAGSMVMMRKLMSRGVK